MCRWSSCSVAPASVRRRSCRNGWPTITDPSPGSPRPDSMTTLRSCSRTSSACSTSSSRSNLVRSGSSPRSPSTSAVCWCPGSSARSPNGRDRSSSSSMTRIGSGVVRCGRWCKRWPTPCRLARSSSSCPGPNPTSRSAACAPIGAFIRCQAPASRWTVARHFRCWKRPGCRCPPRWSIACGNGPRAGRSASTSPASRSRKTATGKRQPQSSRATIVSSSTMCARSSSLLSPGACATS